MQALNELEQNVQDLIVHYNALQQEISALREENERQRQELLRSHSEIVELQHKYRRLSAAHGLIDPNSEQRTYAKQRLNAIVKQIDKAIEVLKE